MYKDSRFGPRILCHRGSFFGQLDVVQSLGWGPKNGHHYPLFVTDTIVFVRVSPGQKEGRHSYEVPTRILVVKCKVSTEGGIVCVVTPVVVFDTVVVVGLWSP